MRRTLAVMTSVGLALSLVACDNKATTTRIPDGSTTITKGMRGFWNAPGGASCRWWIVNKSGTISNNGNTKQKLPARGWSQKALITTGNVGEKFKSDNCGGWTQ